MQKQGKFWVTPYFCAAQSSYCYLSTTATTHPVKISGFLGCRTIKANDAKIPTLPQTSHFCFLEPLSIPSSEEETPRVLPSVIQELQSSEDRGTRASSCPSHRQWTIMNWPSSFIQPSANLLRCSRFTEYSRRLVSYLSFAFRCTGSHSCGGEP